MVRGRSTFLAAAVMALLSFAPSALAAGGFSDVPPGFWARQQIKWAANNGWITPSSPTAFKPHHSVSRLNASRVLARIAFTGEIRSLNVSNAAAITLYALRQPQA